jgi:hypothetical protein
MEPRRVNGAAKTLVFRLVIESIEEQGRHDVGECVWGGARVLLYCKDGLLGGVKNNKITSSSSSVLLSYTYSIGKPGLYSILYSTSVYKITVQYRDCQGELFDPIFSRLPQKF